MKNAKIVFIPFADRASICANKKCKKEFIIPKEKIMESWNSCHHCGSLRYHDKE